MRGKHWLIAILINFIGLVSNAQDLSESHINYLKVQIRNSSEARALLRVLNLSTSNRHKIQAEYELDIYLVDQLLKKLIAEEEYPRRSNRATTILEAEYDLLLNKYYNKLMAMLPESYQKESLKKSQRAWIKFRDIEKETMSNINLYDPNTLFIGTIWLDTHNFMKSDLTLKRLKDFYDYMENYYMRTEGI
ncbi:lysozyme inhibitor LprI family protein [Flammeovirga aprica]|uniref:DUF1311 domain-containing protein n=1 Tax=Flammeovirga aprica JL-4 TaxID=694437 RepID=A0A7X9RRP1_9BACT|nr:lysozyme inhibitor LprI family protein [Flammeovirga aprica]NME68088.1 DUF1311 domain-containing protein [Flammeovirga aprica JL-4]